jgi:predicted aconitase
MDLTQEEQLMLDGAYGDAVQKAMELLVAVGECYGAERMVPVASAHLSCANPVTAGKGGSIFIKNMAEKGGKFIVPTTTNPTSLDPWAWQEMGYSERLYQEHSALSGAIAEMGGFLCNTCVPYLIGHAPRMREHIAWAESSAILYANAVLGARTNREGGPTALASGLTGRTPAYGYHLDENRYGKLKVEVNAHLKGDTDYGTLGYFVGRIAQNRVPILQGIPPSVSQHELKCLGAALATSGSVAHFHVVGVTPEAPTEEVATGLKRISSSDTFEFGQEELQKTEESISKIGPEEADLVVLGCPHPSIDQIKNYAEVFSGRRVKSRVEIWILTSNAIRKYADDIGYANILDSAGVRLVSNTCPSPMPLDFFKKQGYRGAATDSPKMVYYISATKGVPCYYGSLDKFVDIVTNKK